MRFPRLVFSVLHHNMSPFLLHRLWWWPEIFWGWRLSQDPKSSHPNSPSALGLASTKYLTGSKIKWSLAKSSSWTHSKVCKLLPQEGLQMCYYVGSSNLSQKQLESYFGICLISECVGLPWALKIPRLTLPNLRLICNWTSVLWHPHSPLVQTPHPEKGLDPQVESCCSNS